MYCDGLGQEKAISRLTFEKSWLAERGWKPFPHLGYIQETYGACSRKTCDNQKWGRQVLWKHKYKGS